MLWTVVPVLILVIIAIPSFKLMYYMDRVPNPDMTIKVTGHQWYWSYEYPDQDGLSFDSNLIPEADLKPGQKRLLEVDNPLVVPVDTVIRVLGHRHRRDPQLVRAVLRGPGICDRRPAQRELDEGRARRHLLRPVQPDLRHQPRLHADQESWRCRRTISSKWLGDAKKKFAHNDKRRRRCAIAAAAAAADAVRPAPAGN